MAGQSVIHIGDSSRGLFFILTGECRVYIEDAQGMLTLVSVLQRGASDWLPCLVHCSWLIAVLGPLQLADCRAWSTAAG